MTFHDGGFPASPSQEHREEAPVSVNVAVLTMSDTRTEEDDRSGQIIRTNLSWRGHEIADYAIVPDDPDRIYARNLEVPSGGGVVSARGLAGAYNAFAGGGREIGVRSGTLAELTAPPVPSDHGFFDESLRGDVRYALGFMRPGPNWTFGRHGGAFGAPGAGGALGYADPDDGVAYAYVTGRMGVKVTADPRDMALREALDACLAKG